MLCKYLSLINIYYSEIWKNAQDSMEKELLPKSTNEVREHWMGSEKLT